MKTIKLTILAVILACSFQVASAQVRVGVRIGTPPPPRERVVVVQRPAYHHRTYVYRNGRRHYYNRPYNRPARRVVVRRHY
jgi:hypothetical protein